MSVVESDEAFRARLEYCAADGDRLTRRIMTAQGYELDETGNEFGLRRRISPATTTHLGGGT